MHLFDELIRHDVFSHDAYMAILISRGELLTLPIQTNESANTPTVNSNTMPTMSTLPPPTTPASRDDILPPTVNYFHSFVILFMEFHSKNIISFYSKWSSSQKSRN